MTNVYSVDGLLCFVVLFICAMAYFKRVPYLKKVLLSEKKGFWGVFYKAAVIGVRLHMVVSASAVAMALYLLVKAH